MTQLSIFDVSPPDIPVIAPNYDAFPGVIYAHQIQAPVMTKEAPQVAERLYKVVRKIYDITHDMGAWNRCCRIWLSVLRKYEDGDAPYLREIDGWSNEVLELCAQGLGILIEYFWCDGGFYDILGDCYMRVRGDWAGKMLGQYFTPWNLCLLTADRTLSGIDESRLLNGPPLTICDPAIGSGALMLAARALVAKKYGRKALRNLKVSGQDIDECCYTMCRLQMRLSDDWFMTNFHLAQLGEAQRLNKEVT